MPADELSRAALAFQERVVIPHCAACARPCCKLEEVVLELDWRRTRALYQITSSRRAFDRSLKGGTGPQQIREQRGHYFAHGEPCPAYDDVTKLCGVYGTDVKPDECTDFPVYKDGNAITVDLRCEAVSPDDVEEQLRRTFPSKRIRRVVDAQFAAIVTFELE